ncbi:hypothetical protein [Bacillus pumilus]|uniref:hypothetical protein n=1 Tax=Bacillus pumilus TaxID=1408 RepID=UPI0016435AD2|nr:hypothetical protein [Bacillus pumilus]
MEDNLKDNFLFIQDKIDEIKKNSNLTVNQILDLKSFTEIQKNIVASLSALNKG